MVLLGGRGEGRGYWFKFSALNAHGSFQRGSLGERLPDFRCPQECYLKYVTTGHDLESNPSVRCQLLRIGCKQTYSWPRAHWFNIGSGSPHIPVQENKQPGAGPVRTKVRSWQHSAGRLSPLPPEDPGGAEQRPRTLLWRLRLGLLPCSGTRHLSCCSLGQSL